MATHKAIAHNWANCAVKGAKRGKNLYYELFDYKGKGKNAKPRVSIIFSYGQHYVLGIVDALKGRVFLNNTHYSSTTSGHQSDARRAVNKSLTPQVFSVNTDAMTSLANFFRYDIVGKNGRTNYEKQWKSLVYSSLRDKALEAISNYKGTTHRPRLSSGILWRYENALNAATAAREFLGNKPVGENPDKREKYEAYVKGVDERKAVSRAKAEKEWEEKRQKKLREPENYDKWKQERLGFKDPGKSNFNWNNKQGPVTLSIEGNHVVTSNDAQVTISLARKLLGMWEKAVSARTTVARKEWDVGNYRGLCLRYNGTVKIGCTRILPDEVLKLRNTLQTTAVGNEEISEEGN